MKLDDDFRTIPRTLVQSIDILSDHSEQLTPALQLGEGKMAGIGLRISHLRPHCHFLSPVFDSACAAAAEFAIFDHAVIRPNPVGTAEVRYARFGRNACPRESDDPLRSGDQLDYFRNVHC